MRMDCSHHVEQAFRLLREADGIEFDIAGGKPSKKIPMNANHLITVVSVFSIRHKHEDDVTGGHVRFEQSNCLLESGPEIGSTTLNI